MRREDLVPFKHILVSREGQLYLYIDSDKVLSSTQKNEYKWDMIALYTDINRLFDDYWQDDLIAKRDGWASSYEEPRKKDIIYVYEVTDHYKLFEMLRKVRFIKPYHLTKYFNTPCAKLVYERIDGIMEDYLADR